MFSRIGFNKGKHTRKDKQMAKRSSGAKVKSSIMIPKEIMAELKQEAKKTHRSVSGMIAEIVMSHIEKRDV